MPILAKLGDMFVLERILLVCTVLTAGASWALVQSDSVTTFLIAWALQGFSVVGLPLEVALIFDRGRSMGLGASQTRRAAGFLVVALEAGAIIGALLGALLGGRVFGWFGNSVPLTIPAIAVPLHLETRQVFLNIFIAGIGCGALVGAMPAAVAAAAPRGQTGIAAATSTASSLEPRASSGSLTVWIMCAIGALVAAVLLSFVPKLAFADGADELPARVETAPIE